MDRRLRGGTGSFLARLAQKVWLRAALFAVGAVVFALAAGVVGALLPFRLVIELGQNSVGTILQIIATSMLTVTTFSLTAMVTAYSSATTTATPRATRLLVRDRTSQNVLATFIGSFVFSLVGIIALSTGYYTDQGRTILFVGTLVVIVLIVVTLLRWIGHLTLFGRMSDVMDRVETEASDSLTTFATAPTLGARALHRIPERAHPLLADTGGYVTHVDTAALQRLAEAAGAEVYVRAAPGRMADGIHPLAWVAGDIDERAARSAFRIEPHRDYEQDPRLGVIALTEIGSRALSPATNDPGTAIEVIAALQRVFTVLLATEPDHEIRYDRVWIAAPRLADLVDDAFRPLARDGAGVLEVQIRMQKCLAALAHASPERSEVFSAAAADAFDRARRMLARGDVVVLRQARRRAFADADRAGRRAI